jgi:hypothetical protein
MEARPALTQPLLRAREAAGALRFNDPKQPRRSNLNAKLDGGRLGTPMGVLREGEDRRRACERAIGSAMFSNVRSEERNDKIGSPGPPCCRCYVRPMCGRVRPSSDVSEIKLVFSIPSHRPTPSFAPSWNAAPTDQQEQRSEPDQANRSAMNRRRPLAALFILTALAGCTPVGQKQPPYAPYSPDPNAEYPRDRGGNGSGGGGEM